MCYVEVTAPDLDRKVELAIVKLRHLAFRVETPSGPRAAAPMF